MKFALAGILVLPIRDTMQQLEYNLVLLLDLPYSNWLAQIELLRVLVLLLYGTILPLELRFFACRSR